MKAKIELSQGKREYMIASIKEYFLEEREELIGDLSAILILDFFMEKLAPEIYNQAVEDSYRYISEKVEDLFEIQKY